MLDEVYIGFNIIESDSFQKLKREMCELFQLQARNESHITMAFIGKANEIDLIKACNVLTYTLTEIIDTFRIIGVGGLFLRENNQIETITPNNQNISFQYPRVVWFTIGTSLKLMHLKQNIDNVISTKSDCSQFSPHITIGSGQGSIKKVDTHIWDYHDIQKQSTFCLSDELVISDKLHITNRVRQPESLSIIHKYDNKKGSS